MDEQDSFRPNWPAIICVILALIIIGWLMGRLVEAPSGDMIYCDDTSQITAVQVGDRVEVFCQD